MTDKVFSPGEVLTAADVNDYLLNKTGSGNAIINGAFDINQRGFTSSTTNLAFGFDRWQLRTAGTGGTTTWTPQVFTPGTAPVPGYEGTNYSRIVTSGFTGTDTIVGIRQNIEDVRTFAGQTVTASFWARAASGTPNIGVQMNQIPFGSAGVLKSLGILQVSTSWERYSVTTTLDSLTGATISAGNFLQLSIYTAVGTGIAGYGTTIPAVTVQNTSIDIWGVQLEAGSVATPFRRNANSLQGELAACQRYYYRIADVAGASGLWPLGTTESSTLLSSVNQNPVTMRVGATSVEFANIRTWDGGSVTPITNVTLGGQNPSFTQLNFTVASGLTQFRSARVLVSASSAGFIGISAEL
jgi:hypothetical protein